MEIGVPRVPITAGDEAISGFAKDPERLHALLEQRFPQMKNHWKWASKYSSLLAERLGLNGSETEIVSKAAELMDLGMLFMDASLLQESGEPSEELREAIRRHPLEGERALAPVIEDRRILPLIRHHHEWWDGKGYPHGIKGKSIPLGARIIAVADSFVAMLSPRPWRPPCSLDSVLREIMSSRGSQYDPEVADTFLGIIKRKLGMVEIDTGGGRCLHRDQAVAYMHPQNSATDGGWSTGKEWQERMELIELLWDINGVKRGRVA